MTHGLLTLRLRSDRDVVLTRQRARHVAALLGLNGPEQTSLATAASELARDAYVSAGGGLLTIGVRDDREPAIIVRVSDDSGDAERRSRALVALAAMRRLVDEFDVGASAAGGAAVTIARHLPRRAPPITAAAIDGIVAELARDAPPDSVEEVQAQNRELLHAYDELRARQVEVERLNAELAETNRGVLALYAELDEKAESLRRASELKTRFLSDVTHELRTPLNAVISLSQLLLDRVDGELTGEQAKQVSLIHRSASGLNEMVSDLLDIARIESGKTELRVEAVAIADLLGALRGMFRPLAAPGVRLSIEAAPGVTTIETDERKLTQVLRNLLSNALKFTSRGEVTLRAFAADDDRVAFAVADTGVGIAAADLPRIFADFSQVEGPHQQHLRGTGLGLPLTRKLARLLGGDVEVASVSGVGSTFTVTLPLRPGAADASNGDGGAGV